MPGGAPSGIRAEGLRIPLHYKLMVSYLLVVLLVLIPSYVYMRTVLRDQIVAATVRDLTSDVERLAHRLEVASPDDIPAMARLMVEVMPSRLTVVDLSGKILADSARAAEALENHADRPEVKEAIAKGTGTSERFSETTHQRRIYVARRFPDRAHPAGVVRLSVPTAELDHIVSETLAFNTNIGAIGLSAAVLFSLLVALVISRPLRKIAAAARVLGAGDFGHKLDVHTDDELGEVAQSIRELASRLRAQLVASGSDRATLRALLDELPCGVILYGADRSVASINCRARELCDLTAESDVDRAQRIAYLPGHPEVLARVLAERRSEDIELDLPWDARKRLTGRWVALFAAGGETMLALVISDREAQHRSASLNVAVGRAAAFIRKLIPETADKELSAEAMRVADHLEELHAPVAGLASVDPADIGGLCGAAVGELRPRAEEQGVKVILDLRDTAVRVVEHDGRIRRAIRHMIEAAMHGCQGERQLVLHGEVFDDHVRLAVRTPGAAKKGKVKQSAELVHALGGEAGVHRDTAWSETWLRLPRA